jgi:hypothetical protein
MGKYKLPSYPNSENQDAKNNKIMEQFRKFKEQGNRVEAVSVFNLDNMPPTVVPDFKKPKKNK